MEPGHPENTELDLLARQLHTGQIKQEDYRYSLRAHMNGLRRRLDSGIALVRTENETVLNAASRDVHSSRLPRAEYRRLVEAVAHGLELEDLSDDNAVVNADGDSGRTRTVTSSSITSSEAATVNPFNWVWIVSLVLSVVAIVTGLWWLALMSLVGASIATGQAPAGRKTAGGCLVAFTVLAIFIAAIVGMFRGFGGY